MMAKSMLESEIFEQPDVIAQLIDNELENVRRMTGELRGKFKYVVIAARGTSDNAARYAQYLFGTHNHLQVGLATPSLYTMYETSPDMSEALVIGISQSGQSPDIVSVLTEGRRQGRPTIAITNDVTSPLANSASYVIPLHAAPERSVAATKSYTSSLAALALFSCCLKEDQDLLTDLRRMPSEMRHTFEGLKSSLEHVKRYRYMEHCAVIGRGYNYSTAFEVSLKVKELTRTVAEPYSSADFRHGPIATIYRGFPVVLIAPHGAIFLDMKELLDRLQTLQAETLIISDVTDVLETAHLPLPIPSGLPEWLTPLAAILPGQLFALHLTHEKGLNPDDPEGLTKVTETY
jgi:glutamine---fructose-6-phosphate transaminase (isomerizing)